MGRSLPAITESLSYSTKLPFIKYGSCFFFKRVPLTHRKKPFKFRNMASETIPNLVHYLLLQLCFYLVFQLHFYGLTCTVCFFRLNLLPFLENIIPFKIAMYLFKLFLWTGIPLLLFTPWNPFIFFKSNSNAIASVEFTYPICQKLIPSPVFLEPWHGHFYHRVLHHLT